MSTIGAGSTATRAVVARVELDVAEPAVALQRTRLTSVAGRRRIGGGAPNTAIHAAH